MESSIFKDNKIIYITRAIELELGAKCSFINRIIYVLYKI